MFVKSPLAPAAAAPAAAVPQAQTNGKQTPDSPTNTPSHSGPAWKICSIRIPQPGPIPATEPAADIFPTPGAFIEPEASIVGEQSAAAWLTLDFEITAEEAVCPTPLATPGTAAPPASPSSRAAGFPWPGAAQLQGSPGSAHWLAGLNCPQPPPPPAAAAADGTPAHHAGPGGYRCRGNVVGECRRG